MAIEDFWIIIVPPKDLVPTVMGSLWRGLVDIGWSPGEQLYFDLSQSVRPVEASLGAMIRGGAGSTVFRKGSKSLDIRVGMSAPERIDISSYAGFFSGIAPIEELGAILRKANLPRGTRLVGDLEHNLDDAIDRIELIAPISNETLKQRGFFWISQLAEGQWDRLKQVSPDMKSRELVRIDGTRAVLVWDSPYERKRQSQRLLSVAQTVARSTE